MRGVAHDVPGRARAGVSCGHVAGAAGILLSHDLAGGDLHAGFREKTGDCGLLRAEAERLNEVGEVFDGVIFITAFDDGDAYCVHVGIEKIFAVPLGVHPQVVNHRGNRCLGDILGDKVEARSGVSSADREFRLAWKLVSDRGMGRHLVSVCGCCQGEGGIQPKGMQATRGALLVGGGEEKLLGYVRRSVKDGLPAEVGRETEESREKGNPIRPATFNVAAALQREVHGASLGIRVGAFDSTFGVAL